MKYFSLITALWLVSIGSAMAQYEPPCQPDVPCVVRSITMFPSTSGAVTGTTSGSLPLRWILAIRTYGGRINTSRHETEAECLEARERALGHPVTADEKEAAARFQLEARKQQQIIEAGGHLTVPSVAMYETTYLNISSDISDAECFRSEK